MIGHASLASSFLLLAQRARRELDPMEVLWPILALVGLLLLFIIIFVIVRKRFRSEEKIDIAGHELLSGIRELEVGDDEEEDLSPAEYKKIRARLAERIRDKEIPLKRKGDPGKWVD